MSSIRLSFFPPIKKLSTVLTKVLFPCPTGAPIFRIARVTHHWISWKENIKITAFWDVSANVTRKARFMIFIGVNALTAKSHWLKGWNHSLKEKILSREEVKDSWMRRPGLSTIRKIIMKSQISIILQKINPIHKWLRTKSLFFTKTTTKTAAKSLKKTLKTLPTYFKFFQIHYNKFIQQMPQNHIN